MVGMDITVDVRKSLADAKKVIFAPKSFFKEVSREKDWKPAFSFMLVVAGVGHILTALYNLIVYPVIFPQLSKSLNAPESFNFGQILPAVLISFILTLGMSFVWGGALKILLSVFRVEASFTKAYKAMVYSRAPNYLLSWFPFVNVLAALYSFYLMLLALESEFKITRRKAILVIVSSIVILFIFSAFVLALLPSI